MVAQTGCIPVHCGVQVVTGELTLMAFLIHLYTLSG